MSSEQALLVGAILFLSSSFVRADVPASVGDLRLSTNGACLDEPTETPSSLRPRSIEGSEALQAVIQKVYRRVGQFHLQPELREALQQVQWQEVGLVRCGSDQQLSAGCKRDQRHIAIASRGFNNEAIAPNAGVVAHELCHIIGGWKKEGAASAAEGGSSALSGLKNLASSLEKNSNFQGISCLHRLSTYCGRSGPEEAFAEACAAYLVDPDHVKRNCAPAGDFMKGMVFNGPDSRCGPMSSANSAEAPEGSGQSSIAKACSWAESSIPEKNRSGLETILHSTLRSAHEKDKLPYVP